MKIDVAKIWKTVRPILTILTNALTFGRAKGWWTEKHTLPTDKR